MSETSIDADKQPSSPVENNQRVVSDASNQINAQLERFVHSFEKSARRWEIVVYPALFAFVVLAGYGFFLIYSLSNNMSKIAYSLDPYMGPHMQSMSESISRLSDKVSLMTDTVSTMSHQLETLPPMLGHINHMSKSISHMDESITELNYSINTMQMSMTYIRQDIGSMNRNVSRPMSFFNSFAPW